MQLGGPSWVVPLGRRDSTTASLTNAEKDLPSPTSDLQGLTTMFKDKGLSVIDMVALSGARQYYICHTTRRIFSLSKDTIDDMYAVCSMD